MTRNAAFDASGRWSLPQDGEFIPAIPPAPRFMTMREPVALVSCEPTGKTTVRYDNSTGELSVITFQEALPSESSLKYLLAEERAKHPVRRLTFVFSNTRADETVPWLVSKGFYRSESKYCAGSLIAFSKTYPQKK